MEATVRAGRDTWAGSAKPALEHGEAKYLKLQSGAAYAYVYVKTPVPRGATVISATLTLHARGASTGSRVVKARRIAESWKAGKLNWNNKPGVTGSSQPTDSIAAVSDGEAITFDVTTHLQTVANGDPHYGWRIETDASTAHKLYGFNAGDFHPKLYVEWSDQPDTPTSLVPSSASVGVAKPLLQWDYNDVSGNMDLVSVQVQVDSAANGSSPAFDSGEVASTVPELDLAATAYAGLADAATTQWRVRVKDVAGQWSAWSDWVSFARDDKGALTITNPAADPNDYVTEATPPIIWSFTGETQSAWRVRIFEATTELYDTGKRGGTATSHTLPKKILHDGHTYTVEVRVWDTKNREATGSDKPYALASREFTMTDVGTVTAPASLAAAQEGATPAVLLSWTRGTAPDSFTVLRDGKVIDADVDPADVLISGTTYQYRDASPSPRTAHTYKVRAVVNGEASVVSNTATITTNPGGIWLLDLDRDLSCVIWGDDYGTWAMNDSAATYAPAGSSATVRIVTGMRGLEGSLSGFLIDAQGLDMADQEAALYAMKERPEQTYRLIVGDTSIPVLIGDVTVSPMQSVADGERGKVVAFSFWQSGDLPFSPRI